MSDQLVEIKDLGVLLQPHINKNAKIAEVKIQTLLASAGENYGSLMLNVEVKFQPKEKQTVLNVVAKMCPPNEWLKRMFNVQVTFTKEIAMYTTIIPTLQHFQKEQGVFDVIDFFPKCYGGRINLNNSNIVNDDAVLLLENLKNSGYEVVDRMEGFDLGTTQLILKDLAVLHAIPIAMKLLKPDVFTKILLPHLQRAKVFDTIDENVGVTMMNGIVEIAKLNNECIELVPRILEALQNSAENMKKGMPIREPFATINHNDLWVNNTMIQFEDGKPVKNKMVDFQLLEYGSVANDVVFFLFSSVRKEVLQVHYENLIQLYYNIFIATLKDLKCDTSPFTFQLFLEEIDFIAKNVQFFHIMLMLRPIFAVRGKVTELSKMSEKDMLNQDTSDKYKERLPEIILEFARKKWI